MKIPLYLLLKWFPLKVETEERWKIFWHNYWAFDCREIITTMIRSFSKYFTNIRPVYDGKRNMYTKEVLPIGRERTEFEVTLPGDSAVERNFTVIIKWMGQVSLATLDDAMEGRVRQVPFEAVQVWIPHHSYFLTARLVTIMEVVKQGPSTNILFS